MIFGALDKCVVIRFFSSVDDANALRFLIWCWLEPLCPLVLPSFTEAAQKRQLSIAASVQNLESGQTHELNMCSKLRKK